MNVGTYVNKSFRPNQEIVAALIEMFNTHNPIVKLFRMARDRLAESGDDQYIIRLFGDPDKHGDVFSAPVASEVVGLVVGDLGIGDVGRDLIVQDQVGHLQKVKENHCKFMSMQYPILFPYGEDGYHENITYRRCPRSEGIKRNKATMLEYFAYRLHDRADDFNTPMRCKRGTQSYVIDAYCCMEESRLNHYRSKAFQLKYRTASFNEVRAMVYTGVTDASEAGQRVILPSSFIGGPRYLYQNYLDSVALCRKYGCPDLFITFTSNPLWSEVTNALAIIPGQCSADRPDIINRVFHIKLHLLMDDIIENEFFGPVTAVVYTIEFQKCGLPHVHIILWLDKDGPLTPADIDRLISAQLPDPSIDKVGYEAVTAFMIHGPCGDANPFCSCMVNGECSKHYPKEYCDKTTILQNGHVRYARPQNGITVTKNKIPLDNRHVVPHNVDLLVKYEAHINVERVNCDGMEKYLFKYVAKGFDFTRVGLQRSQSPTEILFTKLMRYVPTWNADVLLQMRQHGVYFSSMFTRPILLLSVSMYPCHWRTMLHSLKMIISNRFWTTYAIVLQNLQLGLLQIENTPRLLRIHMQSSLSTSLGMVMVNIGLHEKITARKLEG